jgi:hypothetical protein
VPEAAHRPQPAGGVGDGAPHIGGSGGSSPRADTVGLTIAYSNTNDHVAVLRSALKGAARAELRKTRKREAATKDALGAFGDRLDTPWWFRLVCGRDDSFPIGAESSEKVRCFKIP